MGLDVTAYSRVEYIETMDVEAWEDKYYFSDHNDTDIAAHWEPAYAERAAPIVENGVYRIKGETFPFRAGSYGGYNEWRNWLAQTMLGVSAKTVWTNRDMYRSHPFYELIDFSDCGYSDYVVEGS